MVDEIVITEKKLKDAIIEYKSYVDLCNNRNSNYVSFKMYCFMLQYKIIQ
jgi:hypothetical protein